MLHCRRDELLTEYLWLTPPRDCLKFVCEWINVVPVAFVSAAVAHQKDRVTRKSVRFGALPRDTCAVVMRDLAIKFACFSVNVASMQRTTSNDLVSRRVCL